MCISYRGVYHSQNPLRYYWTIPVIIPPLYRVSELGMEISYSVLFPKIIVLYSDLLLKSITGANIQTVWSFGKRYNLLNNGQIV